MQCLGISVCQGCTLLTELHFHLRLNCFKIHTLINDLGPGKCHSPGTKLSQHITLTSTMTPITSAHLFSLIPVKWKEERAHSFLFPVWMYKWSCLQIGHASNSSTYYKNDTSAFIEGKIKTASSEPSQSTLYGHWLNCQTGQVLRKRFFMLDSYSLPCHFYIIVSAM